MTSSPKFLLALVVLTTLLVVAPIARAADLLLFAAASLKESMDEQTRAFEAKTGHRVIVSYGASNALARQIEAGAPVDVFISADNDWMEYLDSRKQLAAGTRVELLKNALVLVAPSASTLTLEIKADFPLARALGDGKLAMANPDSVPAGKYGKSALQSLGVWASVERHVVRAETVRSALVLVARNEAPLGIVYATDALAEKRVKVLGTFPASSHPAIVYPAAVVASSTKSTVARALLDFLTSADARRIWTKHGFSSVTATGGAALSPMPAASSAMRTVAAQSSINESVLAMPH